ncbi:MAG: GNAT family N-acetyltransferase [Spirochaetales bacterium]|nr:MAG: GNAT family N-acetyltransferase [Spirochaetales bacterium]
MDPGRPGQGSLQGLRRGIRQAAVKKAAAPGIVVKPLSSGLWPDLETLFGPAGACSGCWCLWWNVKRAEFDALGSKGRKKTFKEMVEAGGVHGLIAYADGRPAAWVRLGPREDFPVLQRSPVLKPLDDEPVWSIVCFFTGAAYRGRGLTKLLIAEACAYARSKGARIIEAYPKDESLKPVSPLEAFTGIMRVFDTLGFNEAARRKNRPIMRKEL